MQNQPKNENESGGKQAVVMFHDADHGLFLPGVVVKNAVSLTDLPQVDAGEVVRHPLLQCSAVALQVGVAVMFRFLFEQPERHAISPSRMDLPALRDR